jgi:hypothetical protein
MKTEKIKTGKENFFNNSFPKFYPPYITRRGIKRGLSSNPATFYPHFVT